MKLERLLEAIDKDLHRALLKLQSDLIDRLPEEFDVILSKDRALVKGPDIPAFAITKGSDDSWSIGRFTTSTMHIPELALETYYVRAMRKAILAIGFHKVGYSKDDAETIYHPNDQLASMLPDGYHISLLDTGCCWCGYGSNIQNFKGKGFTPTDDHAEYAAFKRYLQDIKAGKIVDH